MLALQADLQRALQEHDDGLGQEALQMLHQCFVAFMDAVLRLEAPARNDDTRQIMAEFDKQTKESGSSPSAKLFVRAMQIVRDRIDLLKVRCGSNLAWPKHATLFRQTRSDTTVLCGGL